MPWTLNLLARLVFSAILFAAGCIVARKWWDRLGIRAAATYYIARFIFMTVAGMRFGVVPYDVTGWFDHATWMLDGGLIPGRDFLTPYHLGYNLLLALSVRLVRSPFSIIALLTLAEAASLRLLAGVLDRLYGRAFAHRAVILYLASPICLMQSMLSAQDETLYMLAAAAFLHFTFVRGSRVGRSLSSAFAVFCTKLIAPFYMAPILLSKGIASLSLFSFLFFAYIAAAHFCGLNPFRLEFGRAPGLDAQADDILGMSSGGNLQHLFGAPPHWAWGAILVLALGATFVAMAYRMYAETDRRARLIFSARLSAALLLEFLLLGRMTYSYYILPTFPLICALALDKSTLRGGWCPTAAAWMFVFAFKDMVMAGCDYGGFVEPLVLRFTPAICSAICIALSTALLVRMLSAPGPRFET